MVMKKDKLFLSLLMIFTFVFHALSACRYTVREIGFSDIDSKTYQLFFFTNSRTPEEQVLTIRKFSNLLLRDTNVRLEIINVDENGSPPGLKFLTQYNIQTFPSAVFIAPGGESMICSYTTAGQSLPESSWFLLETLVSSTAREDIISKLVRSYGVVLIIEGTDGAENRRVKNAAREAVKTITGTLNQMPKVVYEPPEILVIPHDKTDDEKILLFSLGIIEKNKDNTHVAIIYGRGKLAGPVLMGEQINSRRIYNLLTLVGADCECGIDNSWIMGEMIPLRWGASEQAELIKHLGFDVENPFVKTEMSQIISLKPSVGNPINPLEENLLGFVEGSFEMVSAANAVPKITAAEIQKSFSHENQPKSNLILRKSLISLGVFFFIIVITGFSIFLLHKRRAK
jgi:hypothetical protein